MNTVQPTPHHCWRTIAVAGAAAAVGVTFAYALAFALYAIVRSSWTVWVWTAPAVGTWATLAANAASIFIASVATASLLAVVVALLGIVTASVIAWLLARWAPLRSSGRAVLIGALTALGVAALVQLGLTVLLGRSLFGLGAATYLFWLGLPTLLYIATGAGLAWWLDQARSPMPQTLLHSAADR